MPNFIGYFWTFFFILISYYSTSQTLKETYRQQALDAYYVHDLNAAEAFYSCIIELDPLDSTAWGDRGFIRDENCKYQAAIEDFTHQIFIDPKSVDSYFLRGMVYEKIGRSDEALNDYMQVVKLEEDNSDAHHLIGLIYLNKGRKLLAGRCFRNSMKANPTNVKALSTLGWMKYVNHQKLKAKRLIEKALKVPDENLTMAHVYRGLIYLEKGVNDSVFAHFSKAYQYDNYSLPEIPVEQFSNKLDKKWRAFSDEFLCQSSLSKNHDSLSIIKTLIITGNIETAGKMINRSQHVQTDPKFIFLSAHVAFLKKDFNFSLEQFSKLCSLNMQEPQLFLNRSKVYAAIEEKEKACKDYMHYLHLSPATSKIVYWPQCYVEEKY